MSADSKKLLRIFRELAPARRAALLEYAEFLASRGRPEGEPPVPQQPLSIPRPEQESVVKAIQRLMSSYPMLDRNKLFQDTSVQMTRHVMQGAPASDVIDELEVIFRRHYETHAAPRESSAPDEP